MKWQKHKSVGPEPWDYQTDDQRFAVLRMGAKKNRWWKLVDRKLNSFGEEESYNSVSLNGCKEIVERILTSEVDRCGGCTKEITKYEAMQWGVCLPCTGLRQRAAVGGGSCVCHEQAIPGSVRGIQGQRMWIPCKKCLGTIRQLS